MITQHLPALIIALPLLAAFITPLLHRLNRHARNAVTVIALLANSAMCFALSRQVLTKGVVTYVMGGEATAIPMPSGSMVPIRIMLTVDGFSTLMAISASIIALATLVYSIHFMKKPERLGKYQALILLITASMNGMLLTGDLFNLFVFLEILSLSSAGMIAFWREDDEAPEAAFKYLVISTVASLFVLFAVGLLYSQYGVLNIAKLSEVITYSLADKLALCMLIAGFAMKCGAVPLHMWVPDAYSRSPAPVTALFVVISQISLYALIRTCFTLFGIKLNLLTAGWIIIILGILSMVIGVLMALPQKDIKRLMAFHAISQTGYMLLGVGVGLAVLANPEALDTFGRAAMAGGIFHIINHALYKALLFLTAGAVFYKLGTRDMNKMGGIAKTMPVTTVLFLIGALAIAGIPPFNGFASKFIIYTSVFRFSPALSIIAMVVSILTLASFMKVLYAAFLRPAGTGTKPRGEAPPLMLAGMILLAVLIIAIGLFPGYVVDTLVQPATQALINHAGYVGAIIP